MKNTKKLLAVLICFCMIFGVVSIGIAVSATLSGESDAPIYYEIYDYYKDVNTAVSQNTSVSSDSPWSIGVKISDGWISPDTYSKTVQRNYLYAWNSACVTTNYPGYGFYYPSNYTAGSPLYMSVISPSNVTNDTVGRYKADSAYIFKVPFNGKYDFGKSNQNLIFSDELSNYFAQYKKTDNIDFGVRITVNDNTIWPSETDPLYSNGWAKFGTKDAANEKIEIPSLSNLELHKNDLLRVEFTSFTPTAVYAAQQITGTVSVTLVEMGENEEETGYYELYDFFDDVYLAFENETELNSKSPWSSQFYFNEKWNTPDTFVKESSSYLYASCSDKGDWGSYYPGFAFHFNKSNPRYQMCMIAPTNNSNGTNYDINASYVFTAPSKGSYTFNHSNPDAVVSFDDGQFFAPRNQLYTGIKLGVKITLGDKTIWPNSATYKGEIQNQFATFGYQIQGTPGKIAVPYIQNIGMNKGDVLRVEFTSFTDIDSSPWYQYVTGNVSMTKTSSEYVVDEQAPVFGNGNITLEKSSSDYLVLNWPAAHDNVTGDSNLIYQLYISKTPFDTVALPDGGNFYEVFSDHGTIKNLEPDTDYYTAVVVSDSAYNRAFITGGPFRTQVAETTEQVVYEVYDYLDEISDELVNNQDVITMEGYDSPWISQYLDLDNTWIDLNRASRLGDLIYCNTTKAEWGGYYPGMSFFAPMKAQINYYLARLNPCYAAASVASNFNYNVAYTFTPIYSGKYTFEKSNSEFVYDQLYDGYFAVADSGSNDQTIGVRITLNNEVIWPLENTECTLQDGWAVISGFETASGSVAIPTINNIEMIAGDSLRVEAKAFTSTVDRPWTQQVSANVRMVMTEKTVDNEPPVFDQGDIKVTAKTTSTLTLTWPLASDKLSNDSSIVYKLYYDKKPITSETLKTLEPLSVKGTSQRLTLLDAGTEYYAAIVATDIAGNSVVKTAGPFKTEASSQSPGGDTSPGESNLPSAPLNSNMDESSSGIAASSKGSVTVGWLTSSAMSYYRAYLFTEDGNNYTLLKNSDELSSNTNRYTFDGLGNKKYVIQVVGYNNQGEPFEIFRPVVFNNAASNTVVTDLNNGTISSSGPSKVNNVTTYIKEEGTTQVQDVYETVNNTRTTTIGPTVLEQVLWVVLLVFGGIMLLAAGFLLFLLLKKPKMINNGI